MGTRACLVSIALILLFATADPVLGANQAPTACFSVTPQAGSAETLFSVNAACSTDDLTQLSKLKVRWDWEDNGTWTSYTTTKTASHQYPTEGTRTIRLEVLDSGGLTGTATHTVTVIPPSQLEVLVADPGMEPDIDSNPLDSQNIVFGARMPSIPYTGTVSYPASYSLDGGQSWTRSTGPGPTQPGDPGLEFDGNGNVFLMNLIPGPLEGLPMGVFMAKSTDKGMTFPTHSYAMDDSTPFRLQSGAIGKGCSPTSLNFDYPKLGIDKSNSSRFKNYIYVAARAYLDTNNDPSNCEAYCMAFIRSTDGGATWNSGQCFEDGSGSVDTLLVSPDHTVYLATKTSVGFPSGAICPGVGGIALRRSLDGGATFQSATCAYNSDGNIIPNGIWTAVDPRNPSNLWIAFDATEMSLASQHIYVIKSTDGGTNWSFPIRIDDVVLNDVVDHWAPSLSVSSSGRLDLAWFDYRNSSPTTVSQQWQSIDVYYSYSVDGGTTWAGGNWGTSNIRLSPVTAPAFVGGKSDFLTVISSSQKAYVAYSQDRAGTLSLTGYVDLLTFP